MLFINDIIDIFSDGSCVCKLFADDTKLYATLHINDDVSLSDKLKCVEKWCSEWQLSISVKKCAVVHIHIGSKITGAEPSFAIGSSALPVGRPCQKSWRYNR